MQSSVTNAPESARENESGDTDIMHGLILGSQLLAFIWMLNFVTIFFFALTVKEAPKLADDHETETNSVRAELEFQKIMFGLPRKSKSNVIECFRKSMSPVSTTDESNVKYYVNHAMNFWYRRGLYPSARYSNRLPGTTNPSP